MGLLTGFGVYVLASVVLVAFLWWQRRRRRLQNAEKKRNEIQHRNEPCYQRDELSSDEVVELNENQKVNTLHELFTAPAIQEIPGSGIH